MTKSRKGRSSKSKKKRLEQGKADLVAADPTSVFFSALQHTHPAALAALAHYCVRQPPVIAEEEKTEPPVDPAVVVSAMENLKRTGKQSSEGLKTVSDTDGLDAPPAEAAEKAQSEDISPPLQSEPPGNHRDELLAEIGEFGVTVSELDSVTESETEEVPEVQSALPKVEKAESGFAQAEESRTECEVEAKTHTESTGKEDPTFETLSEEQSKSKSAVKEESDEKSTDEVEPECKPAGEISFEPEPLSDPANISEAGPETEAETVEESIIESVVEANAESVAEAAADSSEGPTEELTENLDGEDNQQSTDAETTMLEKPAKATKQPLRITSAPKEPAQPKGSPLLSGDGVDVIPHAHDKGIEAEFKGVYEKVTQRGSVFDAKHRDAFSSESEKKVRSSYLGLKAISFDEALTAQSEKDPSVMRAQLEPARVQEAPATFAEKAKAVFSVVDMMHKTPVIIATSLICLSFLGFYISNLYRAENYLEEGESLFVLRKYPQSIKAFSEAVNLNPMRARSYFMRGRAYNKIGETGKAANDFSTSLQMNSTGVEVLNHRATLYMRGGKYERALADYRNILRLQPDSKDGLLFNNAALAARQSGKFEEALKYYDRAISVAPDDKKALIGKALCEVSMLQYGKAIEICNSIIKSDPHFLESFVTRGWCNMLLKRDSAAMRDFDFVLARMPLNARASLNRGHLFYKAGRTAEAVRDYSTAVAGDPAFIDARAARGWALVNSNPKLALVDIKMVTSSEQYGASVKFWTLRAQLETQLGKNWDASNSYRKAIKLADQFEPSSIPTLFARLGAVLISSRQFAKAIEACNEALKIEPRNPLALTMRGFANECAGNLISARADYSHALSVAPRMTEALMYRAQYYIRSKEFHSAQKDLSDYLRVKPTDNSAKKLLALVNKKTTNTALPDIAAIKKRIYISVPFAKLLTDGISELNRGNTETAADMLTEAVAQNPSDSTARRYLCHALVREDPKLAVAQFDALRSSGPLPPEDERSYRHALSLAATGSLIESSAIDKALSVVAKDPGNAQACYKLSTLYAAAGMLSKAAQYCQSGLSNARTPADSKKFQDLSNRLNKQHIQGETREDIEG